MMQNTRENLSPVSMILNRGLLTANMSKFALVFRVKALEGQNCCAGS